MSDPIKILLIEDNPGDVRLIREMLSETGTRYNIECVDRLSKGVERLTSEGIDIVLLDLGLPNSKGFDTFSKMSEYASKLPIIVLTGLNDEEIGSRTIRNGSQDYLVKGQIDRRLLTRSIRYAIERKRLEEDMRKAEATQKLMKLKDQFISAVTHELRTPLVSIKGYVDDIVSGEMGEIPEKIASHLEVAKRNTDRLINLVNDLLDIRRLESGRFELNLEYMDLREVVDNCSREIQPSIKSKSQNFITKLPDMPLMVQGDSIKLSQAVMNLLSNATKFAPEGGKITLRVKMGKGFFKIQVSDTGIGIKKQDLEKVFEPFTTIEKPTYIKGTGLGLSVTKGLIEAHGGKIWVESEGEGKGATLTFTLPVSSKPSILIIDDDRNVAKSLSEPLKTSGFDIDIAEDGSEALKKTRLRSYRLALIDILLPDIKGVKLLKKLKEEHSNIKAIIITGHPSVQNAIEALNEGADAYILKPFEPKDLLAKIKNVLE